MASQLRRLIGVSTKMYLSYPATQAYIGSLLENVNKNTETASLVDIFVLVDHVSLVPAVQQALDSARGGRPRLLIGAQDAAPEDEGAFTGQVSPSVLAGAGCRVVMVGHAKRRRMFGETDELVARKAAAVARNGMVPLVCIGERTEADARVALEECKVQIEAVMASMPGEREVILAYEPVWAIGAAEPAGKQHVVAVAKGVRALECVRGRQGQVRIVYGGSAGPGMFEGVKEGIDGLFLARFGLDVGRFWETAVEVAEAKRDWS